MDAAAVRPCAGSKAQHLSAGTERVQTVPPLQRSDLPPSAVDFHVSGIIEWLLQHAAVGPAASQAAQALNTEPTAALKTTMWRHSSSTNTKQLLGGQVGPCQACAGLQTQHRSLHACVAGCVLQLLG